MKKYLIILILSLIYPLTMSSQEEKNDIELLNSKFTEITNTSLNCDNYFSTLNLDPNITFEIVRKNIVSNEKHLTYIQRYKGLEIIGTRITLHEYKGILKAVTGTLIDNLSIGQFSPIDSLSAINLALDYVKEKEFDKLADPYINYKIYTDSSVPTIAKLVIAKLPKEKSKKENYKPYYLISYSPRNPFYNDFTILVDAINGQKIEYYTNSLFSNATGQVPTIYYGVQNIATTWSGNILKYRLIDNSRGNGIETRNLLPGFSQQNNFINDGDNNWNDDHPTRVAASAHFAVGKIWDYFLNNFNRNGPDNAGKGITVYTGYTPSSTLNIGNEVAVLLTPMQMTVTNGFSNQTTARVSLNSIGHEFTHGLGNTHAGWNPNVLTSSFTEAYAIMEGYCDCFGEFAEYWFNNGSCDWIYDAESLTNTALRRTFNPAMNSNNTDALCYGDLNWVANPNGHERGGVLRHWAFILANGFSGTNCNSQNFCVNGLGVNKVQEILYRTLFNGFLSPSETFSTLRASTIFETSFQFGSSSYEVAQVKQAWYAVGVGSSHQGPMLFSNQSINNAQNFNTQNSEVELLGFNLVSPANVLVTSNLEVKFSPDFDASNGSAFNAYISPAICNGGSNIYAARGGSNENGTYHNAENESTFNNSLNENLSQSSSNYKTLNSNVIAKNNNQIFSESNEFKIQPNPSTGTFRIIFSNSLKTQNTITIINALGAEVYRIEKIDSNEIDIDITTVPKGIYIVKINYPNGIVSRKIIKD